MPKNPDYGNLLFLDIETVGQFPDYESGDESYRSFWDQKWSVLNRNQDEGDGYERAGIYAEFGKIVCISVGYVHSKNSEDHIRIKSYASDNEKELLEDFAELLRRNYSSYDARLCAHNGKEFDFPYIARRMLINGVKLPLVLDIAGKKPWETPHLDTMEMWKFGDWKSYTSLNLLTHVFGIPSPKGDIDGSMVSTVYWKEKDLERITNYCQKDVVALIQVFRKMHYEELIPESHVDLI